jgi:hypothetical protein
MKTYHRHLTLALVLFATGAFANDGDPTPRRFEDPKDDAKVKQEMSKRWRNFGSSNEANVTTRTINTGPGGAKGCNTTIGPSAAPAPKSGSGRYGPQPKPSITVVKGSVINVCK